MNRTKYRIWLISIALVAAVFGIFYYMHTKNQEEPIMDGTLVWQIEQGMEEEAAA